eukprot:7787165-Ditylum_brightwellii.AAC.1
MVDSIPAIKDAVRNRSEKHWCHHHNKRILLYTRRILNGSTCVSLTYMESFLFETWSLRRVLRTYIGKIQERRWDAIRM